LFFFFNPIVFKNKHYFILISHIRRELQKCLTNYSQFLIFPLSLFPPKREATTTLKIY
jgi:hypothetical protein